MASRKQHAAELRERAVAMVFELRAASGSSRGTLASAGHKIKDRIGRCKDGQTKVRCFLVPGAFLLTYREAASSAGVTACEG